MNDHLNETQNIDKDVEKHSAENTQHPVIDDSQRLTDLYNRNYLTKDEYYLLSNNTSSDNRKQVSKFAISSLLVASINWIFMLKFTYVDDVYTLLDGEITFYVSLFLAPLSIFLFYIANKEINENSELTGKEFAYAGLAIAIAILSTAIPTLLMYLHLSLS